jgi:hypothetical protein
MGDRQWALGKTWKTRSIYLLHFPDLAFTFTWSPATGAPRLDSIAYHLLPITYCLSVECHNIVDEKMCHDIVGQKSSLTIE